MLNTDVTPIISNINTIMKLNKETVSIDDYENLNTLTQLHIEEETYITILLFLLHKNTDINNVYYQFYEKQYIKTHINFFYEKEKLRQWLLNKTNDSRFKKDSWIIFFARKEIVFNE